MQTIYRVDIAPGTTDRTSYLESCRDAINAAAAGESLYDLETEIGRYSHATTAGLVITAHELR